EFINWSLDRLDDISKFQVMFDTILTKEMHKAWGEPGMPGDAIEIQRTVDKLIAMCKELVEWEIDVYSIVPPQAFVKLKSLLQGWTLALLSHVESIPETLSALFAHGAPPEGYVIEIVVDSALNVEEIQAETKRLIEHKEE